MKLHCVPLEQSRSVYEIIKRCSAVVESHSILRLKFLQASLLIALYEVSNAIYPAAYLTVGHCARLGHALGVHRRKTALRLISTVGMFPDTNLNDPASLLCIYH